MTTLNASQASLKAICAAVVEAIKVSGPLGCPSGHLYVVLMGMGCTLAQYDSLIGALVQLKLVRKSGDLLFVD